MATMRTQAEHIYDQLKDNSKVTVSVEHDYLQYHVPNCVIKFLNGSSEADRVWEELHKGDPRVYIARIDGGLAANMVNLTSGQEQVVAERLIQAIGQ